MAFLTLIAPVVAVTYPIDKINDGSAQGFSKWFREYIFNLLIQPMHLLLYYILITSAFDLAGANLIYSIVAIGFMMPAEKLLRSLFGFEKASTPGTFNGVAGATLAMAGINKISNIGRHGNVGNSLGEAKEKEIDSSNNKPRMNGNVDKEATMIRMSGESETSQNQINDSNNDTTDNASEEGIESGKQENATIGQIPGKIREVGRQAVKVVDNKKAKLANKGKRFVENHVPENIQGLGRGVARVAGAEKAMLANKGKRFIKNHVKPFPKTAFKVSAGVAAASMGVAAGVVTGDPSNALQYGAAGAAAGYVGAGGLIKDGNKEDREVLKEAYYGPKYEAEEQKKYIKDYIKENKAQLNRNFNKQKVKEMSKNGGVIEQSLRNGVDDIKDIMTIQNMMDSGMVKDVNSGITVAQYHRELDNANALSGPNRDKWEEAYSKRLQKKNQKMDKREADKIASRSTDIAERFNKMRKNLHR